MELGANPNEKTTLMLQNDVLYNVPALVIAINKKNPEIVSLLLRNLSIIDTVKSSYRDSNKKIWTVFELAIALAKQEEDNKSILVSILYSGKPRSIRYLRPRTGYLIMNNS